MKRFELSLTIFNLLIKARHSYSSDETIPKNNHFFGNIVFGLTRHRNSVRFATRYRVCSCKINIFRRIIYHLFRDFVFCSSGLFILVDVASSIMIILPWNSIPCNFSNYFCTCSAITANPNPLLFPFFSVGKST